MWKNSYLDCLHLLSLVRLIKGLNSPSMAAAPPQPTSHGGFTMFCKLTWLAHLLEHPAWRIPRIALLHGHKNPTNSSPTSGSATAPVEVNLGRLIRRGVRTISRQRGEDPIDQTAKLFQLLLKPVMGNALWHRNHT